MTQGRDDKLYVRRLELDSQGKSGLNVKPPGGLVSGESTSAYPKPWLTYSLTVNSLNFCQVAWNDGLLAKPDLDNSDKVELLQWTDGAFRVVWNDIHPRVNGAKTGIVMDLHIKNKKKLIVGYEGGGVAVFDVSDRSRYTPILNYYVVSHVQPVLSVRAHPFKNEFVSSSADSLIVKHPINDHIIPEEEEEEREPERQPDGPPSPKIVEVQDSPELEPAQNVVRGFDIIDLNEEQKQFIESEPPKSTPLDAVNVRHSGLSSLQLDSEGDLIMTAGWDGKVRLFSYDDISKISVFHERQGVGCVAFSSPSTDDSTTSDSTTNPRLTKALATRWIAVGGKDGKIELYIIEQGQSKGLLR